MTDAEIEKLWDELEDVPIDEDECLDVDWHSWSKGTHREEIWHWFDAVSYTHLTLPTICSV